MIPAGRSLAIVGENGAGKTTLVKLLCGLIAQSGGTVSVDGVPRTDLDQRAWRASLAVVFQDFAQFQLSARENVTVGVDNQTLDEDRLARVAARAGFSEILAGLPSGWDTPLSRQLRGGVDLSGGQWQRLALTRALAAIDTGASVLVLDEPTANLDVRAEAAFYDSFLELTRGLTTVVISHRFATVRRANAICVLDGGRITELGNHDQLMAIEGTYARMFSLQAEGFQGATDA
jgi:ATP-binding cassette subfamily B protein